VREQADLLDHVPDLTAELVRLTVEHGAAAEQDVAAGQRDHAVDQPHSGRLARAGWAHEHAHLAGADAEVEARDRILTPARISLGDLAQLERRRLATGSSLRTGLRGRQRPLRLGGVIDGQERCPSGRKLISVQTAQVSWTIFGH
jgi:hypothetical protein